MWAKATATKQANEGGISRDIAFRREVTALLCCTLSQTHLSSQASLTCWGMLWVRRRWPDYRGLETRSRDKWAQDPSVGREAGAGSLLSKVCRTGAQERRLLTHQGVSSLPFREGCMEWAGERFRPTSGMSRWLWGSDDSLGFFNTEKQI